MCGDLKKLQLFLETKWFVTFIDDHTHLCWVYLMKEKSKVGKHFQNFYNMIETKFQIKISIFHIDNGTKYFNEFLGSFFERKRYPPSIYLCEYPSTKWNC